jgi:hypothetical protein
MLEQPPAVLVWYPIPVLDVKRNHSHFVPIPAVRIWISTPSPVLYHFKTYTTSRLSKSGTIDSTICLGTLPSGVRPVAQFCKNAEVTNRDDVQDGAGTHTCSTVASSESLSRSKMPIHSCAMFRCNENWVRSTSRKEEIKNGDRLPSLVVPGTEVGSQAYPSYRSNSRRPPYTTGGVSQSEQKVSLIVHTP